MFQVLDPLLAFILKVLPLLIRESLSSRSSRLRQSVRIWSYSGLYFPAFGLNTVVRISPYSVQMRKNTDQNNSEYGHFLRSEYKSCSLCTKILSHSDQKSLIYFLPKSKTVFRKELFCEKIKKWKADRCPYMLWKTCTVILSFVHID